MIIAAYIPPGTRAERRDNFMDTIARNIGHVKVSMNDPFIILAGDFNRFDMGPAIRDFPDVVLSDCPSTRGEAKLDLVATNFETEIDSLITMPPLVSYVGKKSDHSILVACASFRNSDRFKKSVFWKRT